MDWKAASRLIFALTFIVLGAIGVVSGSFAPIWLGVSESEPGGELLVYLCSIVSLVCGAGLLTKRTAVPAAFALFVYLLAWTAWFKFPFILKHPLVEGSYQTNGENAVLIAAAWVLYASIANNGSNAILKRLGGGIGQRLAAILYGLALIAFGLSHFAYLELTVPLVPSWLMMPVFWAYFTGCIYLLTGILLVIGFAARIGAVLAAIEIALITFLVWGPMVLAGHLSAFHQQETAVSWALTAAAWVIAASFEGRPWVVRERPAAPAMAC